MWLIIDKLFSKIHSSSEKISSKYILTRFWFIVGFWWVITMAERVLFQ